MVGKVRMGRKFVLIMVREVRIRVREVRVWVWEVPIRMWFRLGRGAVQLEGSSSTGKFGSGWAG